MLRTCHDSCPPEFEEHFQFETDEEMEAKLNDCVVLKKNRYRKVKRFPDGILKEFVTGKAMYKAKREFNNLSEAWRRGVPSPQPYWIDDHRKDRSTHTLYLFMQDLGDAPSLYELSRERELTEVELESLGLLCRKLIETGCGHQDLHAGNIVCLPEGMKVVDWGKAQIRCGPLLPGETFKLLLGVFASLEPLNDREHLSYLVRALPDLKTTAMQKYYNRLRRNRNKVWEKHFFSRARKALSESGSWAELEGDGLLIHARGLNEEEARRVLAAEPTAPFIKEDVKTRLWYDKIGELDVVVKEFRQGETMKALFGKGRCRQSWMATVQLKARGLPAPLPLAFRENRDGSGRVVMERLDALGVDQWVLKHWPDLDVAQRKYWVVKLVIFLNRFFARNVVPGDLKTCNIMVKGDDFYLVDHDGVEFGDKLNYEKIKKFLIQLQLSTPRLVTRAERWRFLRRMTRGSKESKRMWLELRKMVSDEKILYQSPEGDVSETQ